MEGDESAPWRVDDYRTASGRRPVLEFLESLDEEDYARADALIQLLGEYGNQLRMPRSKSLGDGLFELRDGPIRIFYCFVEGRRVILLAGHYKKSQRTPPNVLRTARRRQNEVRRD